MPPEEGFSARSKSMSSRAASGSPPPLPDGLPFWSSIPFLTHAGIGFERSSAFSFVVEGAGRERPQSPDGRAAHQRRSIIQLLDTHIRQTRLARISKGDHHIPDKAVATDSLDR